MERSDINLVILSPSSEVNRLTFSSISTATTIGELREKISAAVVTHPAPGRQRLIYRGHALVDAKRTLKDVFTQEIIDSSDNLSLHLVLPPEYAVSSGISSTTSNIPASIPGSQASQYAHGIPGRVGSSSVPLQSTETPLTHGFAGQSNVGPPQPLADPSQTQDEHIHGAPSNNQFPPHLQQAFAQFQALNQQLTAQLAAVGNGPGIQAIGPNQPQIHPQPYQHQTFVQPPFLNNTVQQQQGTRLPGGQPGQGVLPQQAAHTGQPGVAFGRGNVQGVARAVTPGSSNATIRETQGPNGERWQMLIQSGHVNMNPHYSIPSRGTAPNSLVTSGIQRRSSPAATVLQNPMPSTASTHFQATLSAMEAAVAGGNSLSAPVLEQAREMLRGIPDLQQESRSSLATRLDNLADRVHSSRESLDNHLGRAAHERATTQRITQGAQSSTVYVLSSPSGPQALLVSPTGFYSAPWQYNPGTVAPMSYIHHHPSDMPTQNLVSGVANPASGQLPDSSGAQVRNSAPQQGGEAQTQRGRQQFQRQQQQPQFNQARDIFRILLPLGGHLWLLIRLFGFVYFFTAGAGWRRTILLGLAASLVFIAQTGIFRPIVQAVWDPIRRHAEGLVPLAGNERPIAGAAGAGADTDVPGTPPTVQGSTPQQAAERLLQERERRDLNFMRQTIRRVERAIALFVASLIPGVGERHIAAREAAQAARRAEAREREEEARREQEQARLQQDSSTTVTAGLEENAVAINESTENPATPGQNQVTPPPLVEV